MNQLLKQAVTLLVAGISLTCAQAAPLTASGEKVVILVSESVTPNGTVSTTARSGPLTTSGSVFSIDRFGTPSTNVPVTVPAVPVSGSFGTGTGLPTQSRMADIANAHLRAQFPGLKNNLGTYMRQYGITSGWFNFRQQVNLDIGGASETWTIYWDFFTDSAGRGAFGEAKLVPADPKTLYVVYTPLRVSSDLPANWALTGAGTLKYQLRDAGFQPVTDWTTINVGGAYDTLESATEGQDAGLACLMDTASSGCTASTNDVKNLMDRTGAVMAVVDYVRRVEPEYIDQPDGTRIPKVTARLLTRELNYSGCTPPTFRNVGNLDYTLRSTVARYLAGAVGLPRTVQYEQIQEFNGSYAAPGYPYDVSLSVPRRDTASLATKAIDPVLRTQMISLSDIPGLQYPVQPIVINGDPNPTIGSVSGGVWQYGGRDDAYQMNWALKCAQYDDGYELATTINATHHWDGWHPNTPAKSPVSSTGWSPIALNDFGGSRYQAYADYARGIVFLQDGAKSGSYSYRASGNYEGTTSGFICAHNGYSMLAQIGTTYECTAPTTTYSCGTALHPYDHYVNGNYIEHVSDQTCTGYMWIRGMYMSDGSPYYEYQELSRVDPSTNAQYNCRNGVCAWEIREGYEPVPDPDPTPTPPPYEPPYTPPTDPGPSCQDYYTSTPAACGSGYTGTKYIIDYYSCPDMRQSTWENVDGCACANGASDYPTCTPAPTSPPQLPPEQPSTPPTCPAAEGSNTYGVYWEETQCGYDVTYYIIVNNKCVAQTGQDEIRVNGNIGCYVQYSAWPAGIRAYQ